MHTNVALLTKKMFLVFTGIATVSSVMAPAVVMGGVPGVGVGERMFPPQAGLTFVCWVCIDQYSDTTEDQHPVRLLTIMRQFRSGSEKIPNVPCLSISISARDRMLVVCYVLFDTNLVTLQDIFTCVHAIMTMMDSPYFWQVIRTFASLLSACPFRY